MSGRRRWRAAVLAAGLVACGVLFVAGAVAAPSPANDLGGLVSDLTAEWQGRIASWRRSGHICLGLWLTAAALGGAMAVLQLVKRMGTGIKVIVGTAGVLVTVLTGIKEQGFVADHRAYLRASEAASLRLSQLERWQHATIRDDAERKEALDQIRRITLELDTIAKRLLEGPDAPAIQAGGLNVLPVAHAQSLAAERRPDWIKGRPADAERIYFVGVASGPSLEAAKAASYASALAAARNELGARLCVSCGFSAEALARYLSDGARLLDTYFDRDPREGYRYYTLVALSKSRIETDTRLFSARERTRIPPAEIERARTVEPPPVAYQIEQQKKQQALADAAASQLDAQTLSFLEKGRAARQRGDAAAAVPPLEEVVRRSPNSYLGWCELAWARESAGLREQAEEAYRRAVALEPQQTARDSSIYNSYGRFLYQQGRLPEAKAALEQALRIDPADPLAARSREAIARQTKTP
jgi:tetratricopeptide (TPR) repeat protein